MQILTGYGGYRKYLHGLELDVSPYCLQYVATPEDPNTNRHDQRDSQIIFLK